jgi:type I restriction enzyme S subunit
MPGVDEAGRSLFISPIRLDDKCENEKYFAYYLKSPIYWISISEKSLGIAIPNVNASKLKQISIPLPPLAEQRRIVAEVGRRLSVGDKMEETISESLKKVEALRQSILKKAFEGKLPNESELEEARNAPDWKPAEKLPERIHQEKQIKEKNNKPTRKKNT